MAPLRTRRAILALGATGVAAFTGCLGADGNGRSEADKNAVENADPDAIVIMTTEQTFDPAEVEIEREETVVWRNEDTRRQSVTAYEETVPNQSAYFASGDFGREITARVAYPLLGGLNTGERFTNTFETAGRYHYFSIPAEGAEMTGTVVVRD